MFVIMRMHAGPCGSVYSSLNRPEEDAVESSSAGVIGNGGCWKLNSDPCTGRVMPLTNEPSLQPLGDSF